MQVHVTTFGERKIQYIEDTLKTLLESDWAQTNASVCLFMGSEEESHVAEFASHPSVRIIHWDQESDPNLRWNCTLNKIRALRYGDDDGGRVICEDDILFPRHWFSELQLATAELAGEEYVLSLFAAEHKLARVPLLTGKERVKRYPGRTLNGAQAVYYPNKAIRIKVATYLEQNLRSACGDDLIGQYALMYAKLYATKEPLVENVGAVSCFL